jgi:DNA-binding GntR family transcriptional regulator
MAFGAPEPETEAERAAPKLDPRTLWQRVHEHLREEILSGRLPPGSVLQEVALAESLGVSRGPLREAIGRLQAEGLVTVRPRRGAIVRALTPHEFLEAYQVREVLEILGIRLAVPRLSANDVAELEALVDEMAAHAETEDAERFFDANDRFHRALVHASANARLIEMHGQLLGQMGRYRMRSLALRGNLARSVGEHRAILRAAKAGNAERAERLLGEHIRVPQRRLEPASDGELLEFQEVTQGGN